MRGYSYLREKLWLYDRIKFDNKRKSVIWEYSLNNPGKAQVKHDSDKEPDIHIFIDNDPPVA